MGKGPKCTQIPTMSWRQQKVTITSSTPFIKLTKRQKRQTDKEMKSEKEMRTYNTACLRRTASYSGGKAPSCWLSEEGGYGCNGAAPSD